MQQLEYDIALPAFSFADKDYKEPSGNTNNAVNLNINLWIISLVLFLL